MGDVLNVHDMVQDVYHNFMPVYHDYVVQRSEFEAPETVRVKTFLAGNLDSVALEMANRYRGRNKRLAFNSLLRGNNPLFARSRCEKRVTRDGVVADFDAQSYDNDYGRSIKIDPTVFRAFPEDENLEVAIEFREFDNKVNIDEEIANGIVVTSVLDLVQDGTKAADPKSLNYLSGAQAYNIYKSRVNGFQEKLMQRDEDEESGFRNEIHIPFYIDPNISHESLDGYMKSLKTTESLNGFCELRDYRELGKIGSRFDSFDGVTSASVAKMRSEEAEEEVINPIFDCSWDSNPEKSRSQSRVGASSSNSTKNFPSMRSVAPPVKVPNFATGCMIPDSTDSRDVDEKQNTESVPLVLAIDDLGPDGMQHNILNSSIDSSEWGDFQ